MADELQVPIPQVVGGLVGIWSWWQRQSRSGHAAVTLLYLDRHADVAGLSRAMVNVGWLRDHGDGTLSIPRWDRWLGQSAKKRLKAARRQARKRLADRHAAVTPPSRSQRDKSVTTGQDNRRTSKRALQSTPTRGAAPAHAGSAHRPEGAGASPGAPPSSTGKAQPGACPHCHGALRVQLQPHPAPQFGCAKHPDHATAGVLAAVCAHRPRKACREWSGPPERFGPRPCGLCAALEAAAGMAATEAR